MEDNEKELDVHLQEYASLRAEISNYIQRIDRIRGLYLASAFAVVAIFLRPEAGSIATHVWRIENDRFLLGFLLLLPILNSILFLHLLSLNHFIHTAAKYTMFLGSRVRELVGTPVIGWDTWDSTTGDRKAWSTISGLVGLLTFILAMTASLAILYRFSAAGRLINGPFPFLLYLAGCLTVSLALVISIVHQLFFERRFGLFQRAEVSSRTTLWYLLAVPVAAVIYVASMLWGYR